MREKLDVRLLLSKCNDFEELVILKALKLRMNDIEIVLSSAEKECSDYSVIDNVANNINSENRSSQDVLDSKIQVQNSDNIKIEALQFSTSKNVGADESIVCKSRFTTITPRKLSGTKKSRRFLFSSSSEIVHSSTARLNLKRDIIPTDLSNHQTLGERRSSKCDPHLYGLRREVHLSKSLKAGGANKGKIRAKPLIRSRSHMQAMQSSPYNQVLVCPHASRRKPLSYLIDTGKGTFDSRWKNIHKRKDKQLARTEIGLNSTGEIGSNSTRDSNLESHQRRSSGKCSVSVARVKKMKSFIVVDDSDSDKQSLNSSFVINVLTSFVQQGLTIDPKHDLVTEIPIIGLEKKENINEDPSIEKTPVEEQKTLLIGGNILLCNVCDLA